MQVFCTETFWIWRMSLTGTFNGWKLGHFTLDATGTGGETLLTRAIHMQAYGAVKDFLDLGCSPDAANAAGEKPLVLALQLKDRKLVNMLLENRANVLADAPGGLNLAQYARKLGMPDVATNLHEMIRHKEAAAYAWAGPYC